MAGRVGFGGGNTNSGQFPQFELVERGEVFVLTANSGGAGEVCFSYQNTSSGGRGWEFVFATKKQTMGGRGEFAFPT